MPAANHAPRIYAYRARQAAGLYSGRLIQALNILLLLLAGAIMGSSCAYADDSARIDLQGRLEHFADKSNTLEFADILANDSLRARFRALAEFRSLGYDTASHWFRISLRAADGAAAATRRVLSIGSPELEKLDVWVEQASGGFKSYALGSHQGARNNPVARIFALRIDVFQEMQIYLRVRTTNAINVYAELLPENAFVANEIRINFANGLYFGILLITVLLYAILGLHLRDAVVSTYACYVLAQLLFHLGATGYLQALLAGESAWLIDALPRIGWLGGSIAIVLMWSFLLDLRHKQANIYRLYIFTITLNLCLAVFALLPALVNEAVLLAVKLANYLNVLNFVLAMLLLIKQWRKSHNQQWLVYLVAFIIPTLGVLVNTLTNQGLLPWNFISANFYQLAVLVHVFVMSYGLALRLRQLQQDKIAIEHENAVITQRAQEQRNFVALLSHEFGNPLAAIDRAAQMLQLSTPGLAPKELERLAKIRANTAALADFVERFLLTEALENGALKPNRQPCDIRSLLEELFDQQSPEMRARIELVSCPTENFALDKTLVGIAVGNLLTNALRYSPAESPVEISAAISPDGLRISVADHGLGLSAAELAKLGHLYFRGSSAVGKKGSGLGYHFSRRIMQAHGGSLSARSNSGCGLLVEIFLPRSA